ncbi:DUF92 domain-containing protein [Tumebacillus lipolyticus]|uniref:DUF92 domain-containing protein n=1 Tax=Tumebacillus lipolyticus TaxID=1280370 RepID=A0ABW4ZV38_9BACL
MDVWVGLAGSASIALIAYRKRSLTRSGALAAIVVGSILYGMGSLPWFGTLIAFFLSSTLLTKWKGKQKSEMEENYEKTGRRDAGQVFANGGLGVLLCICAFIWESPWWWLAFVGVMSTVNADTWATEIGSLSKRSPRFLLTGRTVAPGTSGGVTALGLLASLAGGLFIGAVAWLFAQMIGEELRLGQLLLIGGGAGLAGSLFDSLLGALFQAMYKCTVCQKETERRTHCGVKAAPLRGLSFLNNDWVNSISSVFGGAVAMLIGAI